MMGGSGFCCAAGDDSALGVSWAGIGETLLFETVVVALGDVRLLEATALELLVTVWADDETTDIVDDSAVLFSTVVFGSGVIVTLGVGGLGFSCATTGFSGTGAGITGGFAAVTWLCCKSTLTGDFTSGVPVIIDTIKKLDNNKNKTSCLKLSCSQLGTVEVVTGHNSTRQNSLPIR